MSWFRVPFLPAMACGRVSTLEIAPGSDSFSHPMRDVGMNKPSSSETVAARPSSSKLPHPHLLLMTESLSASVGCQVMIGHLTSAGLIKPLSLPLPKP